ncbi:MAG: helix-turn-helix domain-containing protein [Bacilli bacterium]|nr:helix-turn-helix domain-containing protein [Bacilli bacterium]
MNEIQTDDLQCYTLAEAAEKLQVSNSTLLRFINEGKIRAFKSGHGWRISRAALNDYIAAQESKARKK